MAKLKGIQALYNLLLKDTVKKSGEASGIMSIGSDVRNLAEKKLVKYLDSAKQQKVDLDKMSEDELKYILEMNKPQNKMKIVSQDDPEFKGIMDAMMGKKKDNVIEGKFSEFSKEVKDLEKRINSGVASTVEKILGMDPIDAMKEANKVIGRKGQYKNLSQEDAKKILQDTEDHIFERNVDIDPEDMFADGGRIGLKKGMDRRTFMKIMGGLTTIPVLGKFFKGAEVAAPVVEKAAEVASGAPPYFFNLVNRIRALGKKFDGPKERTESYKYKDYEMQIDNDTGQIEISKQKLGYDDRIGEGVVSEEYMSLKPGRADETTGGRKVVDEYEENTGFTDKDGKLKDVEPGVSDETVMDGSISKEELEQEIIEQLSKEAPSIKKASGGIARMLGE